MFPSQNLNASRNSSKPGKSSFFELLQGLLVFPRLFGCSSLILFGAFSSSPPARWGSLDFIRVAFSSSPFSFSSGTARPQLRAPALSGHCRTSTARWALPDLNREPQTSVGTVSQTPERMSSICQKECQIECQNKYAIYTSRWYVRNHVRIVFQDGDHSKKGFFPTLSIAPIAGPKIGKGWAWLSKEIMKDFCPGLCPLALFGTVLS